MKKYDNRSNICDIRTLAFIKVKEKRSYKSFITEKYIRMSGMKNV